MYKVSIIMPVYNAERYLRDSLDSIVAQTIGVENLEVIIVDDASTDSSADIIDEYCAKYPNFRGIHLEENIGAAYGPRNIALREVTSEYVMFLDADDTFVETACEDLYNEISHSGVGMVFGRYYRVYDDEVLKSYSPYSHSVNDIKKNPRFSGIVSFLWSNVIYRILYGRPLPRQCKIVIDDIREHPEILAILPLLWTRIVRRDAVGEFPALITGEDLNFILDIYNNAKIIFLNNKFITNYNMRFDGDLSITKNIKFSLVYDSIRAYRMAIGKCNEYNIPEYNRMINPFLLNYINLVRQGEFTQSEKGELLSEIDTVDKIYENRGLIGSLLVKLCRFVSK